MKRHGHLGLLKLTFMLFLLSSCGWALPVGVWKASLDDDIGTIAVTDSTFTFSYMTGGVDKVAFTGPIAETIEPKDGNPGRLVVGPTKNGKALYEVVWYFEPVGPRARFFLDEGGFQNIASAQKADDKVTLYDARVFYKDDFFTEVGTYAPLPAPDKAALMELLQEAIRRHKAEPGEDPGYIMETIMIERKFHPVKSREIFAKALEANGEDPQVKAIVDELLR